MSMRRLLLVVLLLVGCREGGPDRAPAVADTAAIRLTGDSLRAAIRDTIRALPDSADAFGGLRVRLLGPVAGLPDPLWAVWPSAMFTAELPAFINLYTRTPGGGWRTVARQPLGGSVIDSQIDSVAQTDLNPSRLWLQVGGPAGAHAYSYQLMSFDGWTWTYEADAFSSDGVWPARLRDADGDGKPDLWREATDFYVFCYACGVRRYDTELLRWTGAGFDTVRLSQPPPTVPLTASWLTDRALALARADLWMDARDTARLALAAAPDDRTIRLNAALISDIARGRADTTDRQFPLLSDVFLGDYRTAAAAIRRAQPEALFGRGASPLVAGTVAEFNEENLSEALLDFTGRALRQRPASADIHLVRAWGLWLLPRTRARAAAELTAAARLAPTDPWLRRATALISRS